MKKIFTLCACALLSCMSIARAESVTVYITDDNKVEYQNIDATLTKSADGVWSLSDFLNCGSPIEFTFDENIAVDAESAVTITGNYSITYTYYYRVLNSSGKYPRGKVISADGTETVVRYPCVYNEGKGTYCYITRLDKAEYGYDYYAYFSATGRDIDGEWTLPWYDYEFYFNAVESDPVVEDKPVSLGNVEVDICNDNDVSVAKSYTSELSVTGNVYTLANFINSDASLLFTFDSNIAVGDYAAVTFKGNLDTSYAPYYYVKNSNNKYPVGKLDALEGASVTDVYYPLVYQASDYAYVTRLDKSVYGYDYYTSIYFSGLDADNEDLGDYYLQFYFNGPSTSGISVVEANDENAPVEYYNLSGQRVENPANGIYIRKQGSKVQKVVIR